MKILLTGGAGFIGSAVIRHLLDNTDDEILNVDVLTYAGNLASIPGAEKNSRYLFSHTDICDQSAISSLMIDFQPDVVMHLAAESHVDRSIDGPGAFIQTNLVGSFSLLQASLAFWRELNSEKAERFRFHHISTDEVYGDLHGTDDLFTEQTPYAPSSPYSASKAGSDHLVRAWGRTYGLPVLVTNCSNNYGPFQFPEKLIPHMILNGLSGKPLPVYGDGQQIRDWLYVEDHAIALHKVVSEGVVGETYNIGGHNEKTNLEVVHTICALLDEFVDTKPDGVKNFADLITFVDDRPGHDLRYAIDAGKMLEKLDWTPAHDFESGMRKTVLWYLQNTQWWQAVLDGSYQLARLGND